MDVTGADDRIHYVVVGTENSLVWIIDLGQLHTIEKVCTRIWMFIINHQVFSSNCLAPFLELIHGVHGITPIILLQLLETDTYI